MKRPDANEVLRTRGEAALRQAIDGARINGQDNWRLPPNPKANGQAPLDWQPPAYGAPPGADGIVTRVASSIKPEPVTWIWPQRIPRGKLSILGGHPGEGKTLLSTYVVAVVSTGGKWPDGAQAEAGNVVILSAEDDAADTIVPRLMAHGADLSRVHILDAVRVKGSERWFSLVEDLL